MRQRTAPNHKAALAATDYFAMPMTEPSLDNQARENQTLRILGIDPGLNVTGYGIIDVLDRKISVVEAGVIRSIKTKDLGQRLNSLFVDLVELMESTKPDVMAMEELYSHYDRPKTAILMGHARGVFCLAAAQHNLLIHHYASTQVKRMLTGNGRAPKTQMQIAITQQLNLSSVPDPPDVADALAIALCHHHLSKTTSTIVR
jgi:crossover junction endodeoxyribonuclease RuvC